MSSNEWPLLEGLQLEAVLFAYNEGFSKSYARRVFPNPFSERGSQADAYDKGVRDGTAARDHDDKLQAGAALTVLDELAWVRNVLAEYGYSGPLSEAACPLRELLARESATPTEPQQADLYANPASLGMNDAEFVAAHKPVLANVFRQTAEEVPFYLNPVVAKAGDHRDAFDAADRALALAYPDFNNLGPGHWGSQSVPNYGILRGAIAKEILTARRKKEQL